MEKHTGFEPAPAAWKAAVLPLHQCSMWRAPVSREDHIPRACDLARKEGNERKGRITIAPWRAEQDLNLLPPAVLAGVLPKAPPARIAATVGGKKPNHLGFLRFSENRM